MSKSANISREAFNALKDTKFAKLELQRIENCPQTHMLKLQHGNLKTVPTVKFGDRRRKTLGLKKQIEHWIMKKKKVERTAGAIYIYTTGELKGYEPAGRVEGRERDGVARSSTGEPER